MKKLIFLWLFAAPLSIVCQEIINTPNIPQSTNISFGDMKYSFQTIDHVGWVKLDGRLRTALSATQQTQATALGIGANIPNTADRTLVGVSGTKALNTTGGAAAVNLAQNQLPNVVPTATTPTVSIGTRGVASGSAYNMYSQSGNFNGFSSTDISVGGVTISSINGNVTQQSTPTQDPYIAANCYIYLGL